jgi:hypothetical protein
MDSDETIDARQALQSAELTDDAKNLLDEEDRKNDDRKYSVQGSLEAGAVLR